jgi:hypothetical protein
MREYPRESFARRCVWASSARPGRHWAALETRVILDALTGVRPAARGWIAPCRAHDDRSPSLSITEGRDRVLVRCHTGCAFPDIATAMGVTQDACFVGAQRECSESVGFSAARAGHTAHLRLPVESPRAAAPPEDALRVAGDRASAWPETAFYEYTLADGSACMRVHWQECPVVAHGGKRKKRFWQEHVDDRGEWISGLERLTWRPLYRAPEIAEAIALEKTVLLVEGEKTVDAALALGYEATCNAGGANGWRPEHAEQLAGADVVILPDHDVQGRAWAKAAASALADVAARVRVVAVPGLPEKGNLADYRDQGGTTDRLTVLLERAPTWNVGDPIPEPAAPSRFRVRNTLPADALSAMIGAPQTGKSFAVIALAGAVTTGLPWLGVPIDRTGPVLILAAEGARGHAQRRRRRARIELREQLVREAAVIVVVDAKEHDHDVRDLMRRQIHEGPSWSRAALYAFGASHVRQRTPFRAFGLWCDTV